MIAGAFAVGVAIFSEDLLAALWTTFLISLAGACAGFCVLVGATAVGVVEVDAKAPIEIKPATRVAISLLISWTFQLFVKSSK